VQPFWTGQPGCGKTSARHPRGWRADFFCVASECLTSQHLLAYRHLLGVIEVTDKPPPQPRWYPHPAEKPRFGPRGWLILAAVAGAIIVLSIVIPGNPASHNTGTTAATTSPPHTLPTTAVAPPAAPIPEPSIWATDAESSAALATLATLAIKGRAPKTGYDRSILGDAWTDDVTVAGGHNGCDTRFLGGSSVLRRAVERFGRQLVEEVVV
jgi:hypothetical protein